MNWGERFGIEAPLLDNLEQAIEPAAHIVEALTDCAPELSLLATSRIPVGVPNMSSS